jgi:GNAT superfamily N-acetyltransferase
MQVRPIVLADMESLKWLGAALKQESPEYRGMTYSISKVEEFVTQAADEDVKHITGWVAVDEGGHIAGFMFAYTSEHIFFEDTIAWDGTLYLQPAHRGKHGSVVIQLIKNYVEWAEQWGGPIKFGLTTGIETERLEQMLQRFGFETTGKVLNYVR